MIAVGTGIAPFMSFLQHVKYEEPRKIWLFYGCRYADRDFLYKNQIEMFLDTKVLAKFSKSFSRDSAMNVKYVQDNIRLYSKKFVAFMGDAIVYVCGGKKMSEDVFDTITNCVSMERNCTYDDARLHMMELRNSGRYIEDIWN